MTDKEYSDWLRHHRAMFDIAGWLARMKPAQADDIMIFWQKTISKLDHCMCVDASDYLFNQTPQPKYSSHPAVIARYVREQMSAKARYYKSPPSPSLPVDEVERSVEACEAIARGNWARAKELYPKPDTPQPVRNGEPEGGF